MNEISPHNASAVLDVLKQAVSLLEQSNTRTLAQQNEQQSEEWRQLMDVAKSLGIVKRHLSDAMQNQPDLRAAVANLAKWFAALAETSRETGAEFGAETAAAQAVASEKIQTGDPAIAPIEQSSTAPAATEFSPVPEMPRQQVPLAIGDARTLIDVQGSSDEARAARQAAERVRHEGWFAAPTAGAQTFSGVIDIAMVVERCKIKAEGCEWAARYRDSWEDVPVDHALRKANYESIVTRARALPNCYVWALNPKVIVPGFERMTDYAQAFHNLGSAAELAESMKSRNAGGEFLQESYALLAEAQSAIRAALDEDGLYADSDQEEVFRWLRSRTSEDRVLVIRHMKLEDPADIADATDLAARIAQLRERFAEVKQQDSQRRAKLSKAKYHARLLRENQSHDEQSDWRKFTDAINDAIELGVHPSDVEIRDIVAPMCDLLPDDLTLPPGFERALEAVDKYLATREADVTLESRPRSASPEVTEAASLLEGRVVVLIGGEVRAQAKRAMERDLHLAELRWIPGAHHQSYYLFESSIARPETAVVMLAIRWASHSFESVAELCRKYGKLYVRLPGGYNPNQVAKQILEQVGEQLRKAAPYKAISG